jgi:hypothetical protein
LACSLSAHQCAGSELGSFAPLSELGTNKRARPRGAPPALRHKSEPFRRQTLLTGCPGEPGLAGLNQPSRMPRDVLENRETSNTRGSRVVWCSPPGCISSG